MDLKVYERTRYQNIYRHKKNKNYVIAISKPKTSISRIDNKKIYDIDEARRIRDNPKIKLQKKAEIIYKGDFDDLWNKYIFHCEDELKLAYNTVLRKQKMYKKYLKEKFDKKISKIKSEDINKFINDMNTTDKQKNQMIKELKAFFNWAIDEEYLIISPMKKISNYKVEKTEMKFWTPENIQSILKVLDEDINTTNFNLIKKAYLVKTFILIGFCLGDRVGETRALTFDSFDRNLSIVKIKHSINYDRKNSDFLSNTKNYHSQRDIEITHKLIQAIDDYKNFLINYTEYDIKDTDIIFFNYKIKKPYTDTHIRKAFYYYCDKAEVPRIRMYDLRHTYVATMMAEGKELYHISRRLGHINYSTTVNKYGHLSNQVRKEIAEITDKYF